MRLRSSPRVGWALVVIIAMPNALRAAEVVSAEDWSRPRDGIYIARLPALAAAVNRLIDQPSNKLLIRYPEGEDGVLWAQELRGWLVALGISSNRVDILSSSTNRDALELAVVGLDGVELDSLPATENGATSQPVLNKGAQ